MIWKFQHQVQSFFSDNRSYSQRDYVHRRPAFLEGFNLLDIELVWSR